MPAGLVTLGVVPVIAGAIRLADLAGDPVVTDANARFVEAPVPVVLHIVAATFYTVVGAFQFHPGLRRRRTRVHRLAGRVLAPAGILVAASGLWMTLAYDHPEGDREVLTAFRLVFGTVMLVSVVLGVRAVLRHDVVRHRAWMTRAYAIGQGAGTQVLVFIPVAVLVGRPGETATGLLMGLAWVVNLAVAEWFVRRA